MTTTSRRDFLKLASAASVAAIAFRDALPLDAYPLGLPLGLQLYSLRELLPKDFDGTLKAIAAAGYTEVEAAGFYAMSAQEFKQSMDTAGLHCVSAHYPLSMLQPQLESILDVREAVGTAVCRVLVAVAEGPVEGEALAERPGLSRGLGAGLHPRRLEVECRAVQPDRRARSKAYGMKFGYHNHTTEFRKLEERRALRRTDEAHRSRPGHLRNGLRMGRPSPATARSNT